MPRLHDELRSGILNPIGAPFQAADSGEQWTSHVKRIHPELAIALPMAQAALGVAFSAGADEVGHAARQLQVRGLPPLLVKIQHSARRAPAPAVPLLLRGGARPDIQQRREILGFPDLRPFLDIVHIARYAGHVRGSHEAHHLDAFAPVERIGFDRRLDQMIRHAGPGG